MPIGSTPITITGNVTAAPELRFTQSGVPVTTFTVAATEKTFRKESGKYEDGDTLFLRVNIWREAAEHVAESVTKGMRVTVTGTLKQRNYETKEGDKRTVYEVQAEDVAVSLRWGTAKFAKAARTGGGPVPEDPWASSAPVPDGPSYTDEPPF